MAGRAGKLVMVAPAPVQVAGEGRVRVDAKFLAGMAAHVACWDGPVEAVLWQSGSVPFAQEVDPAGLGFGLRLLAPGQDVPDGALTGAQVVLASGDMAATLDLGRPARAAGAKLVYAVEYTLRTRMDILRLDRSRGPMRKARSALWLIGQERRRRAAFRAADAVQFNGYPAERVYGGLVQDSLTYLDGRISTGLLATAPEVSEREARIGQGLALRLVHSGRLEAMKGAQDLVPVALALRDAGVPFTLDIFGAGSLAGEVAQGIASAGLDDQVRLHAPVDFETALVPWMRRNADLFLSCHRQGDPSCSYLEAMGCGLAVLGYDNEMWGRMAGESGGGWAVPMGQVGQLSAALAALQDDRAGLILAASRALDFARAHDFETEFRRRMAHLAQVARAGR